MSFAYRDSAAWLALAAACLADFSDQARAHGVVGPRFFPATIATDDPFVADELSLPTVSHQKTDTDPSVKETDINGEFSKRLTPTVGVSLGGGWTHLDQAGPPHNPSGWQNLELGVKWQFFLDPVHEAVASIGLNAELGGPGARRVGADPFTTFTPTVLFGKGAGDLPESLNYLRPLAVTGSIGYAVPTTRKTRSLSIDPDSGETLADVEHHSDRVEYGFALEYSMPYLHSQVRDLGLPEWVNRLTPLVEFNFSSPMTGRFGEKTMGTINPGVIWSGQQVQFGIEAIVPATVASGKNVGLIAQVHFYLDDIFPDTIGRPLFGK